MFLAGGNSDKIRNAMALVLINHMGLAVILFMLRNAIGVANALSSAEMAFAGIKI